MNFNTLNSEPVTSQTGKLAIALYPNALVDKKNGKQTWYARVINRRRISMEDVANDMVSNGVSYSKEEILSIWQQINNAIIVRLSEGISVDTGLGTMSLSINGSFESGQSDFSKERHRIDVIFRKGSRLSNIVDTLEPITTQGKQSMPEITSVIDKSGKDAGYLTPGSILVIKGKNIAIAGDDENVGLYFENMTDSQDVIKLTKDDLGVNTNTKIICIVPSTLLSNSSYRIKIVTQCSTGKHIRTVPQEAEYLDLLVT